MVIRSFSVVKEVVSVRCVAGKSLNGDSERPFHEAWMVLKTQDVGDVRAMGCLLRRGKY